MNIIEFFFGIFKECFNVINVDFFGLGFTWLEFLLGCVIIFVVLGFLKGIVGVGDSIPFDNIVFRYKQSKMSNRTRENQVVRKNYPSSDYVDVFGDGTYLVPWNEYFGED